MRALFSTKIQIMGSRLEQEISRSAAWRRWDLWQGGNRLVAFAVVLFAISLVPTQAAVPRQPPPATPASQAAPGASSQRALLNQYCVSCHSGRMKASGASPLALDTLDLTRVGGDPDSWEKVVLKLRAGLMPPAGRGGASKANSGGFVS